MKAPTLAIFGHSLFLVEGERVETTTVAEVGDLAAAVLPLVQGLHGPVDVVYHPADLQVIAAECANTSRAKLHAYFAGEYREMANPALLWACTRPLPHRDGKYATILHHEARPRLEMLLARLAEQGVVVRVVLPPAAGLVVAGRGPPIDLAIVHADDCYLFYHLNELGIPIVRFVRSVETLGEHVAEALASRQRPPAGIRLVGQPKARLAELLETHALAGTWESWPDFLRDMRFDPRDPANFAQRPFRWQRRHTHHAVAATLALAALALAAEGGYRHFQARRMARDVRAVRQQLEREVARLEDAERKYRAAEAVLAAAPLGTPRPSLLLDAVTQTLPAALQLQAFRYSAGAFSLEGIAWEAGEKSVVPPWVDTLGSGPRGWKLKPARITGAQWTVSGQFSP